MEGLKVYCILANGAEANGAEADGTLAALVAVLGGEQDLADEEQLRLDAAEGVVRGVMLYEERGRLELELERLKGVREFLGQGAVLPSLLLTRRGGEEVFAEACDHGFWEVLHRDELLPGVLPRVIRHCWHRYLQQREYQRKQDELETIMRATRCCLIRLSLPDARLMEAHGQIGELLGLEAEAQLGKSVFKLPGFEYNGAFLQRLLNDLRSQPQSESFLNYRRPDGKQLLFQVRLLRESATVALGMVMDVSQQREARQVRHLLEQAIHQSSEAVFLTCGVPGSAAPEVVFLNRAAEELLGYTLEELRLLGTDPFAGLKRDKGVFEEMQRRLMAGHSFVGELVQFNRASRPFLCQTTVHPIRGETGLITHYLTQMRDLTQERKARRDLEDSEHRLRQVVERAPFPIMILAEDGAIVHMSRSWLELSGYPNESFDHIDAWIDRAGGERKDRIRAGIQATFLSRQRLIREEGVVQHADGSLRMWYFHSAPIQPLPDGRALIVTMASDVTDLKRALLKAEKANRTKDEFLAVISHELRTPLNPILALSDLMKRQEADSENREMLEMINTAGKDLLRLIDNILDYTRIEFGVFTANPQPIILDEFIHRIVEVQRPRFAAKGLQFRVDHDGCGDYWLEPLHFDPSWIERLLVQLLDNALKFTAEGGVELICSVARGAGSRALELRCAVRDTGIGIAPSELSNIVAPFYQVDSSTTRAHGGTGLGLAVCSRILSCFGSRLEVKSTLGKGSTFAFALPVTPGPVELLDLRMRAAESVRV